MSVMTAELPSRPKIATVSLLLTNHVCNNSCACVFVVACMPTLGLRFIANTRTWVVPIAHTPMALIRAINCCFILSGVGRDEVKAVM